MKANEAPEKIYLQVCGDCPQSDCENCKFEPKFKVGDEIKAANEESLIITKIDEKGYWSEDLFICDFDDADNWKLVGQKSAWSEEDDIMANDICYALRCQITYPISRIQSMSTWISNFKDRVQPQPKQEWSEEDEDILNTIINHFEIDLECTENDDIIRWLKSLRPQKQWKPSDEQMTALRRMKAAIAGEGEIYKPLNSLYEDLKKLKAL